MSNVLLAFGRCYCTPKLSYSLDKFFFPLWLYYCSNELLQLVPYILYRIHIWWFGRCFPPVYACCFIECLCIPRCMLRVIILHEPMAWRHFLFDKWQKSTIQNSCEQLSIHSSLKYTNTGSSKTTYTCPDMHLHWVLGAGKTKIWQRYYHQLSGVFQLIIVIICCELIIWSIYSLINITSYNVPWFVSRFLASFTATELAVTFHLDSCFIWPYYILEIILEMILRPVQSLYLVLITNHLTIAWASKTPAKPLSASKNGTQR